MRDTPRVVVTGIGVVSSIGVGREAFWNSLMEGRSGITEIQQFDASGLRSKIAGEINDFDITNHMPAKEAKRLDKFCHYAIAAGDEAVEQSGIQGKFDPERTGVLASSGIGGICSLEQQSNVISKRGASRCSPLLVPMMIADMGSGCLSIRYDMRGPNFTVVTACASGSHSIGEASWVIKRGDADVMLAGGAEACLCELGLAGFNSMKALSTRNDDPEHASRPFDADRDGFVPADGAGMLVLESLEHAEARGADILAEVIGYGASGDAYHITAPDTEGKGASKAINVALNNADISPEDIDYVNAHGTSTPLNDKVETTAIKKALGDSAYNIPVSSTKSVTGHTLGAAGGLESAAALMSIKENKVPGTMNHETKDEDCDLDYVPNGPRETQVNTALNFNFGFGGHNAVLVFQAL